MLECGPCTTFAAVEKVPIMSYLNTIWPIQYVYWLEKLEVGHGNDEQN